MGFDQLGLSMDLLRAVSDAGYDQPTPIQQKAIPAVFMGRDVLGCAQTGTGKTASFTLPMLDMLAEGSAKARMPRALILEPTRELATQVADNFDKYGKFHPLSKVVLIGGRGFTDQERLLERGVDVLIATPGRLLDLFERGKILLNDTRYLVIDEADRMLDMGFIPDVERIVSLMPRQRQTLFFSATMPPEIRRLADAFLIEPREITVDPPSTAATTVDHSLTVIEPRGKAKALRILIEQEEIERAIIFCNRKKDIGGLTRDLKKHGLDVGEMHGDMPQPRREATLEDFRAGKIKLLIASDVAARGIDVQEISHVFNYDVPGNPEDYVHRIGRTGRAGRAGRALTLATPEDGKAVAAINRMLGNDIRLTELPGFESVDLDPPDEDPRRKGRGNRSKRKRTDATGGERPEQPRSRGRSPRHKAETTDEAGQTQEKKTTEKRGNPQREPKEMEAVVGMGNDLPAFLVREIPVVSKKEKRK